MKKGFVLMETLICLTVLTVSLMGAYTLFANALSNFKYRKLYDNVNDLYKVNAIRQLIKTYPENNNILLNKENCAENMEETCISIIENFNVEKILITSTDVTNIINSSNDLPNTMFEYMKTIYDKEDYYVIVLFNKNDELYYASLKWKDNKGEFDE